MEKKYTDALLSVIKTSNISDMNPREVSIRPVSYDADNSPVSTLEVSDYISFNGTGAISNAWVAGNILIFTALDGYLERKHRLAEGALFRNHYQNLPETTDLERIQKNTYRIMKVVRNAIQHNMSSISLDAGGYSIFYNHNGTDFKLQISKDGMDFLYTVMLSLIQEAIPGMGKRYSTEGHYQGMLQYYYNEAVNKMLLLQDDIQPTGLIPLSGSNPDLKSVVRYRIKNPVQREEDDKTVTFKCHNDGSEKYSSDYVYGDYLLPEELGRFGEGDLDEADKKFLENFQYSEEAKKNQERIMRRTITFDKSLLNEKWKINE